MKVFLKYIGVGFINTSIGYLIIVISTILGFSPFMSNLIGYIFGISISYLLNKNFVFRCTIKSKYKIKVLYFISFLFSYFINLISLNICIKYLDLNEILSQLISIAMYSMTFFLSCKRIVFKNY